MKYHFVDTPYICEQFIDQRKDEDKKHHDYSLIITFIDQGF